MIAHVCARGKSMPGLMRYLYGPGRKDEHADQHMVASSGQLSNEWDGALSASEAGQIGRIVEAAWREHHVEQDALVGASTGGRVWDHRCSRMGRVVTLSASTFITCRYRWLRVSRGAMNSGQPLLMTSYREWDSHRVQATPRDRRGSRCGTVSARAATTIFTLR